MSTTETQTHWSSDEVVDLTGVTYRQLDYWCRSGIFSERFQDLGSGFKRRFDRDTVFRVAVIARVSQAVEALTQSRFRAGSLALSRDILTAIDGATGDTLEIKCGRDALLTVKYGDLRRKFEEL